METPLKTEEHLFSIKKFEEISKIYILRNEHFTCASQRFQLLSKLTFNLAHGHFNFVYELLKSHLELTNRFYIEPDPNEQTNISKNSLIKNWLQLETIANRKFLNGKTPLILCTYIEQKWSVTLTRLLIQAGADIFARDTVNNCQALHYACARLRSSLIDILLRNVYFDLSKAVDANGNTPLVYFIVSYYFNEHKLSEKSKHSVMVSLDNYLDHLNRSELCVDTVNNLGYSVSDFFYMLVNGELLEKSGFFRRLRTVLKMKQTKVFEEPKKILRKNLVITLREVQSPLPVILHDRIPDASLIFMFVRKGSAEPSKKARREFKSGYGSSLIWYNRVTGCVSERIEWRPELRQLFDTLQVQKSPSYKPGVLPPFTTPLETPEPASSLRLNKSICSLNSSFDKNFKRHSIELAKITSFHKRAVLSHSHRK